MISNQILQHTIDGLKGITHIDFCLIDTEGTILASTFPEAEKYASTAMAFAESPADSQIVAGCQYFKVFDEYQMEYVLLASGDSENLYIFGKIAAFQLQNLLIAYKERYDRDNFIKNLLLDNLLLIDIYNRAKKLHIETEAYRVVYIVESGRERDNAILDRIREEMESKGDAFVTAVDDKNIIVILRFVKEPTAEDLYHGAEEICAMLTEEECSRIAYGTVVNEIKEVSRSYKEARMSMEVGKIFFEDREIVAYSALGIGRLIYQLPIPLCKMFIREIFGGHSPDEFDEETLATISKFFENSLNVSETSRQLYIHRNTLVYRLDKLQKSTGLDLRVFEDAITFKIALMVVKYMKHMETADY